MSGSGCFAWGEEGGGEIKTSEIFRFSCLLQCRSPSMLPPAIAALAFVHFLALETESVAERPDPPSLPIQIFWEYEKVRVIASLTLSVII